MRFIALAILVFTVWTLAGCASNEPQDPNQVSSIPWNRPERWEGQGPLGSFMPQ